MKWEDSNGVEIKVGQLVAYNYSGQVVLGRIEQLPKRKKHSRFLLSPDYGPFHIKRILSPKKQKEEKIYNSVPGYKFNPISKVKDGNSIMVIDKDEIMIHFI